MKSLLFFSHNNKKVYEVEKILRRKDIKILNLNFYNKIKEPIENGNSFADNAKIKSSFGFNSLKYHVLLMTQEFVLRPKQ